MSVVNEVEGLLEGATTDAQFRTVMSRSYYVSFRTMIGVVTPLGFNQDDRGNQGRSVHRRLQDFLRSSSKAALRNVGGKRLRLLFTMRVTADYDFTLSIVRARAAEAVGFAQDIDDWIREAGLDIRYPTDT